MSKFFGNLASVVIGALLIGIMVLFLLWVFLTLWGAVFG